MTPRSRTTALSELAWGAVERQAQRLPAQTQVKYDILDIDNYLAHKTVTQRKVSVSKLNLIGASTAPAFLCIFQNAKQGKLDGDSKSGLIS